MAVEPLKPTAQPQMRRSSSSSKKSPLTPPSNLIQVLQVEQYRLEYLKRCQYLKRPPQSLRLSGAKALTSETCILLISEFETVVLKKAIEEKEEAIHHVKEDLNNINNIHLEPLSPKQKETMRSAFQKEDRIPTNAGREQVGKVANEV